MKLNSIQKLTAAVLSSLLLSACPSGGGSDAPAGSEPDATPPAQLLFSPFTGVYPLPTNLLFNAQSGQAADGTINIPSSSPPAVAASQLDGWSTTAPAIINMSEAVNPATVAASVRLLHLCINPADKAPISPLATAYSPDALIPGVDYLATVSEVDATQILVKPLKPLRSKFDATGPCIAIGAENGYIVAVANTVKTAADEMFGSSPVYALSKSTSCYYRFVENDPDCSAGPAGITQAGTDAGLGTASDASLQSTEKLRRLVVGQEALAAAFTGGALNSGNIILSFSFSTQTVGKVLAAAKGLAAQAAATAPGTTLLSSGTTTGSLLGTGTGNGKVYAGSVTLPYYLPLPTSNTDAGILSGNWVNSDGNSPNLANPTTPVTAVPVKQGDVTVPVFAVMPNVQPNGVAVPVAILQHGITSNRTQILALADSLAAAGIASVAIDLPLHGVTDASSPVRVAYDFATNTGERTFDINLVTNSAFSAGACDPTATAPTDEERDSSGAHFINLPSLLTSRDNLRQAVADLLMLEKLLANFSWLEVDPANNNAVVKSNTVDDTKLTFVGHSLGGIVGSTFISMADNIKAASLVTTGGGIAKLLDASAAFGPVVAGGLQAQGVLEGTSDYEQFLLFAQTAVDSVDSLNHLSNVTIPVHAIMVSGGATGLTINGTSIVVPNASPPDLVVPNDAFNPSPFERADVTGLGGSVPLANAAEQQVVDHLRDSCDPQIYTSVNHLVRFDSGSHGTLLRPFNEYPDGAGGSVCIDESKEIAEMHSQVVKFLASEGAALLVDAGCAAP